MSFYKGIVKSGTDPCSSHSSDLEIIFIRDILINMYLLYAWHVYTHTHIHMAYYIGGIYIYIMHIIDIFFEILLSLSLALSLRDLAVRAC